MEAIKIVQKWSKKHPRKTKKEAFLEMFPNALTDEDGYPSVSVCEILGNPEGINSCSECDVECKERWDEPAEVEE